jgi:hypothetical protein
MRNLQRRKYCLTCSPFKSHNTANLTKRAARRSSRRTCVDCSKSLDISSFYNRSGRDDEHYMTCKACWNYKRHLRQKANKQKAVDHLGGSCVICGYDSHLGSLHFHHVDPSEKEYDFSSGRSLSFEKVKAELEKCILVCGNCHSEIHAGLHPKYLISNERAAYL